MTFIIISDCKGPAGRLPGEDEIEISWELIGNNRTARSFYTAEFVIINNSRYEFDSTGWVLYFNQLPRTIIPGSITGEVNIDNVNGDLFCMTPAKGFSLMPGDTATIRFDGSGWIIKKIGAPQGLFFVFYDRNNQELASVPVKNYAVKPFPELEKVFPFMGDTPMPTPEWQYEVNRSATLLKEDQLKRIIPSPVEISGFTAKVKLGEGLMIHYDEGLEGEAGQLAVMRVL